MTEEQELRLRELISRDVFYQELLEECRERAVAYERILASLPEEDQDALELYIAVCEELQYRQTCLAAEHL